MKRFTDKTSPDGECIRFTGSIQPNGYGQFRYEGRTQYAHRVAFKLFKGELDNSDVILHSCDNRWCVNPEHLTKGTQADNLIDAARKGRAPGSKLTLEQVALVKESTLSGAELARQLNVSRSLISCIRKGKVRKYL